VLLPSVVLSATRALQRILPSVRLALVVGLLWLCADTSLATAMVVRVRWRPSSDPVVVGYKVYTRLAGRAHGDPARVNPPLQADGTKSFDVAGLTAGLTYYFAVSAYLANGTESTLSDELSVGPTNPCYIDHCYTPTACQFGPSPDGTTCSGSDPCSVCRTGACSAAPMLQPVSSELHLVTSQAGSRVRANGTSDTPASVEPPTTGVSVDLSNTSGTSLYRLDIPASAFKANPAGTSFQIRRAFRQGFGSMRVKLRNGNLSTSLSELGPEIAASAGSAVTLVVRFGSDACFEANLSCEGAGQMVTCR